jgi:hypothetical protein
MVNRLLWQGRGGRVDTFKRNQCHERTYAVYCRIAAGRVEHDKDVQGLTERLRAPFCHPNATSPALEAQLLAVRIRHPRWEPKKLGWWLA